LVQQTLSYATFPAHSAFGILSSRVDEYQNSISYVLPPVSDIEGLLVYANIPGRQIRTFCTYVHIYMARPTILQLVPLSVLQHFKCIEISHCYHTLWKL